MGRVTLHLGPTRHGVRERLLRERVAPRIAERRRSGRLDRAPVVYLVEARRTRLELQAVLLDALARRGFPGLLDAPFETLPEHVARHARGPLRLAGALDRLAALLEAWDALPPDSALRALRLSTRFLSDLDRLFLELGHAGADDPARLGRALRTRSTLAAALSTLHRSRTARLREANRQDAPAALRALAAGYDAGQIPHPELVILDGYVDPSAAERQALHALLGAAGEAHVILDADAPLEALRGAPDGLRGTSAAFLGDAVRLYLDTESGAGAELATPAAGAVAPTIPTRAVRVPSPHEEICAAGRMLAVETCCGPDTHTSGRAGAGNADGHGRTPGRLAGSPVDSPASSAVLIAASPSSYAALVERVLPRLGALLRPQPRVPLPRTRVWRLVVAILDAATRGLDPQPVEAVLLSPLVDIRSPDGATLDYAALRPHLRAAGVMGQPGLSGVQARLARYRVRLQRAGERGRATLRRFDAEVPGFEAALAAISALDAPATRPDHARRILDLLERWSVARRVFCGPDPEAIARDVAALRATRSVLTRVGREGGVGVDEGHARGAPQDAHSPRDPADAAEKRFPGVGCLAHSEGERKGKRGAAIPFARFRLLAEGTAAREASVFGHSARASSTDPGLWSARDVLGARPDRVVALGVGTGGEPGERGLLTTPERAALGLPTAERLAARQRYELRTVLGAARERAVALSPVDEESADRECLVEDLLGVRLGDLTDLEPSERDGDEGSTGKAELPELPEERLRRLGRALASRRSLTAPHADAPLRALLPSRTYAPADRPLGPRPTLRDVAARVEVALRRDGALDDHAPPIGAFEGVLGGYGARALAAPETWRARDGAPLQLSPTALEAYVRCPFRSFAERRIGLRRPPETEVESLQREKGELLHEVLCSLLRELPLGDRAVWRQQAAQAAVRILRREGARRGPGGAFWRQAVREIGAGLEGGPKGPIAAFIEWEASRRDALRPHLLEQEVKHAIKVDGLPLQLGGKVDRVDVASEDPTLGFCVYDYKTGKTTPTAGDLRRGIALQLPIYLGAVWDEWGAAARPLALGYYRLADPGRTEPRYLLASPDAVGDQAPLGRVRGRAPRVDLAELRARARDAVAAVVRSMRAGRFPLGWESPTRKGCRHCPARRVCRVDHARMDRLHQRGAPGLFSPVSLLPSGAPPRADDA